MSSLPRLTAAVSSMVAAACAILAVACDGVKGVEPLGPAAEEGGTTLYSPDASDAPSLPEAAPDVQPTLAPVFMGNPLCQVSASSCCSPDSFSVCAPTACEAPVEAGVADGYGGYAAAFGCHVAPAMVSVPDATNVAAALTPPAAPACLPAGLGRDGVPCDGPSDCAPGYECVGTDHKACRHYCCGANVPACVLDEFCDIQQTAQAPALNVPVCMPVQPCELLSSTCGPTQTCAVVREDGTKSCVAVGSATAGQSCDAQHCASGLVCLGTPGARTCYTLCSMKAGACQLPQTCKGGPPLFVDPGVGICE